MLINFEHYSPFSSGLIEPEEFEKRKNIYSTIINSKTNSIFENVEFEELPKQVVMLFVELVDNVHELKINKNNVKSESVGKWNRTYNDVNYFEVLENTIKLYLKDLKYNGVPVLVENLGGTYVPINVY